MSGSGLLSVPRVKQSWRCSDHSAPRQEQSPRKLQVGWSLSSFKSRLNTRLPLTNHASMFLVAFQTPRFTFGWFSPSCSLYTVSFQIGYKVLLLTHECRWTFLPTTIHHSSNLHPIQNSALLRVSNQVRRRRPGRLWKSLSDHVRGNTRWTFFLQEGVLYFNVFNQSAITLNVLFQLCFE